MKVAKTTLLLEPAVLGRYQRRMHGEFLTPPDRAVEAMRGVDNQPSNRQPILIARCLSAHDVALAIALAREMDLGFVVAGRDPGQVSQQTKSGFVLIERSELRQIVIDPLQQIALVQPGATNDELVQAAAAQGFGVTNSSAGGSVADEILAFELVTVEGAIITASAQEHVGVFSALRSGTNLIGVVTATIYRLHPLPPA